MYPAFPHLRKSRLSRFMLLAWLAFVLVAPIQFCMSAYAAQSGASQSMDPPCPFMGAVHGMHMPRACGGHGTAAMHLQCHRSQVATGAGLPQPSLAKAIVLPQPAWQHSPLLATRPAFYWLTDNSGFSPAPLPAFLRYSRLLI